MKPWEAYDEAAVRALHKDWTTEKVNIDGMKEFGQSILRAFPDAYTVLDYGCGTGRLSRFLPVNFSYVGFDRSAEMIAHAREVFGHHTFTSTFPTGEPFDVVASYSVLQYQDDESLTECLKEMSCATMGLVLALYDGKVRKETTSSHSVKVWIRTEEDWRALLAPLGRVKREVLSEGDPASLVLYTVTVR